MARIQRRPPGRGVEWEFETLVLPKECRMVLNAPAPVSEMAATYIGGGSGGDAGASIASVIGSAEEIVPRPDAAIGASAYLPSEGTRIPLPEWRPVQ